LEKKATDCRFYPVPASERLAERVAAALAESTITPVVIVDSPLAAQGLKALLCHSGWPRRQEGAPLPWCVSLDQAFERLAEIAVGINKAPPPRARSARRVQLAQQLLDHPEIAASLGGAPKAALDLAGQWVEIFEGWEWLASAQDPGSLDWGQLDGEPQHLASDLNTLRSLQAQNQLPTDRAAWARASLTQTSPVWFCLGRTPCAKEIAMAVTLFKVGFDDISVWFSAPNEVQTRQPDGSQEARRLIASQSIEESAWAAAQTIREWRAQGLDDVGVVALDRKAVRRLRALMERSGEALSDRSGWALDTTVAATAVVGLNDLLTRGATTQTVLEWVHSPFVSRGLNDTWNFDADQRRRLDAALRGFGRVTSVTLTDLLSTGLLPFSAVRLAFTKSKHRQTPHRWATQLLDGIEYVGLELPLAQDPAGQTVLAAIKELAAQTHGDDCQITGALWRALLSAELNQARFVESSGTAAVRVCSLASLSWQLPKALVVIGAEEGRLPERPTAQFFEPERFAQMGLQLPPQELERQGFAQLESVWNAPIPIVLIACSDKPDSAVEFSNWIELLALHAGDLIQRQDAGSLIGKRPLRKDAAIQLIDDHDAQWPYALPLQLSVSELQSLFNCPYQFALQTLMGLRPLAPLAEESPPTDIGSLIHLALSGATRSDMTAQDWEIWLAREIDRLLQEPFFAGRRSQAVQLPIPKATASRLRASSGAMIPGLARWLAGRPKTIVHTEQESVRRIEGLGITVKGRLDRIEEGVQESLLIDFKTSAVGPLRTRVKRGHEDIQLALYAWLVGVDRAVREATYACINQERVDEIGVTDTVGRSIPEITEEVMQRVVSELTAMGQGAPISATGLLKDKKICKYCKVRGVCRRTDLSGIEIEEEDQ